MHLAVRLYMGASTFKVAQLKLARLSCTAPAVARAATRAARRPQPQHVLLRSTHSHRLAAQRRLHAALFECARTVAELRSALERRGAVSAVAWPLMLHLAPHFSSRLASIEKNLKIEMFLGCPVFWS